MWRLVRSAVPVFFLLVAVQASGGERILPRPVDRDGVALDSLHQESVEVPPVLPFDTLSDPTGDVSTYILQGEPGTVLISGNTLTGKFGSPLDVSGSFYGYAYAGFVGVGDETDLIPWTAPSPLTVSDPIEEEYAAWSDLTEFTITTTPEDLSFSCTVRGELAAAPKNSRCLAYFNRYPEFDRNIQLDFYKDLKQKWTMNVWYLGEGFFSDGLLDDFEPPFVDIVSAGVVESSPGVLSLQIETAQSFLPLGDDLDPRFIWSFSGVSRYVVVDVVNGSLVAEIRQSSGSFFPTLIDTVPLSSTANSVMVTVSAEQLGLAAGSQSWFARSGVRATIDGKVFTTNSSDKTPDSGVGSVSVTDLPTPANVRISRRPGKLVQVANVGGDTTTFALRNTGETSTMITLGKSGDFFTQSPESFTLDGGKTRTITVTGTAKPGGTLTGSSIPSGDGVPPGLEVDLVLTSVAPPSGGGVAVPSTNRVDVKAPPETTTVNGSVDFANSGTGAVIGIVSSDVPWLIAPDDPVTINPGATVPIEFSVDRTQRSGGSGALGSASGTLSIDFITGPGGSKSKLGASDGSTSLSLVTIVDTSTPPVNNATIPPLGATEVAFYLAGIGHTDSSVGTFVTDLAINGLPGSSGFTDLSLYYVADGMSQAQTGEVTSVAPSQLIPLADVVSTVFEQETLGTLQIRTGRPDSLGINASVFNKSNPRGTFGSAVPVLRSDRAVLPGESMYIPGVLGSSEVAHTNMIIQEVLGRDVTVVMDFLGPDGSLVGTRSENIAAFRNFRGNQIVPAGAVSVVVTNSESSKGGILAFATPLDKALEADNTRLGGDTWIVTDWPKVLGYGRGERVVIPVAGVVLGVGNTFFRTDASIMNVGESTTTVALTFYPNAGSPLVKTVELDPMETVTYANVMGSLFELSSALGYIAVDPGGGELVVTSRTFATMGTQVATFGTGVPAVAVGQGLVLGKVRRLSALEDSADDVVNRGSPATFRTNLGLLETSGKAAKVKVTLSFEFASSLASARAEESIEVDLQPFQFTQLNGITKQVLGDLRDAFPARMLNLYVDVEVIEGEGTVETFASSADNGTGDQIVKLR